MLIDPTPRVKGFYPSEVVEDAQTHLPSHVEIRVAGSDDESIALDYKVIEGHWVITHGTFSATEHAVFLTFKVVADVTFSDIAFPSEAPDPRSPEARLRHRPRNPRRLTVRNVDFAGREAEGRSLQR